MAAQPQAGLAFEPMVDHLPTAGDAEVELWLMRLDVDAEALERMRALLSGDELARAGRFHFLRDAARFVAGRGSLRMVLGALLTVDPGQIRLVYDTHGKPELAEPFDREGLRFNLSHSEGIAICAVARGRRIGVDIERVRPLADWDAIAERMFTPQETRVLRGLPETERLEAFFTCWTRYEARIKASSEALDRARDLPSSGEWTLRTLRPVPGYLAAVAVEGPISRLVCRDWPPERS
jgi:4'-phosphopantetheinyl transferase